MMTRFLVLCALLIPQAIYADDLPTDLFGFTLGMTTTRTEASPSGELPVKRVTGIRPWNRGARYYYEPASEFEGFPFLDYQQGTETSYGTNFYSIVFPIIPDHLNTMSEWVEYAKDNGEEFKVMTIEYTSDEFISEKAAYEVATEMCAEKAIELGMDVSSEVDAVDLEKKTYNKTCIFSEGDRELEISQFGLKFVYRLKYTDEYLLATNEALAERVDAMKLKDEQELSAN